MDLRLIHAVLAVAEAGSVVAAARRLDYSTSSLSSQVGELERLLDLRLLRR